MNLELISSWAEIIEAVVIIVSLIYLALQVKQNTQTTRAAAAQAQVDAYASVISPMAQSKDGARAWFIGMQDTNNLKDEEIVMFYAQANMFFRMVKSSYYQHKVGALEPQLWEGMERLTMQFQSQKGVQQFLEIRGHCLSNEFRGWLEKGDARPHVKTSPYLKPKSKKTN